MTIFKLILIAGLASASAFPQNPIGKSQLVLSTAQDAEGPDPQCNLPPVLDPSADGLPSSAELFSTKEALMKQVKRHQAIVRVPSVSFDDLGDVGEDKRWEIFGKVHEVLGKMYPIVHERAKLEKINTYGLVYTFEGSDKSLKPILLAAHQDVVPVEDESAWAYPPFSGHYDGQYLWGRGAQDDKSSLTALISVMEELLENPKWQPRRTVILAFGFDEECLGLQGAGKIGQHLTERYGDNGIAMILDEGGLGMIPLGNVTYALASVVEKGHVDVWFRLHVPGGHSSMPFPHTGIGIMSEIVTKLEANPYEPRLTKDDPVYSHLSCQARYSPDADPKLTELVRKGDLDGITKRIFEIEPVAGFLLQTSQAVDVISGGQKINSMPELTTLGVNYRVSPQDSVQKVQHNIVMYTQDMAEKHGLEVKAFEGDVKYETYAASVGASKFEKARTNSGADWRGTLVIEAVDAFDASPRAPTSGVAWDTFSGTLQHTFATKNGIIVPAGENMLGNTDTRHYWNLTPHIYRFEPLGPGESDGGHTVDERIDMKAHMNFLKFYYDLIRNYDVADLEE